MEDNKCDKTVCTTGKSFKTVWINSKLLEKKAKKSRKKQKQFS